MRKKIHWNIFEETVEMSNMRTIFVYVFVCEMIMCEDEDVREFHNLLQNVND